MSAPASAWADARSAPAVDRVRSLSTSQPCRMPQWPWSVYSHGTHIADDKHFRVSLLDTHAWRAARHHRQQMPHSLIGPSSSGIPKRSTARTPSSSSSAISRGSFVNRKLVLLRHRGDFVAHAVAMHDEETVARNRPGGKRRFPHQASHGSPAS